MATDVVVRLRSADFIGEDTTTLKIAVEAADQIERLRTIGKELLDALTEMADKGMLPKITCRLCDAAQTMEEVLATDV